MDTRDFGDVKTKENIATASLLHTGVGKPASLYM